MMNATEEIGEIVRIINNSNVDIVFFGGDMINIHHSEINSSQLDEFSRLKPRDGVFMVLGNHDTGAYIKNSDKDKRKANIEGLVHKVESAGWVVLRDSTIYVRRGSDSIAVTGIDYNEELLKYKHSMDAVKAVDFAALYKCVPDSIFNITLSHLPQLWYSLCDKGYSDLTLSGHIHAMQMKICSFSQARFMYKEWSGLYEKENGKLYINDGIGCVGYMARFGARPEITVIELSKK
jgi:predicted MPP superfamily phosphohydrolase